MGLNEMRCANANGGPGFGVNDNTGNERKTFKRELTESGGPG